MAKIGVEGLRPGPEPRAAEAQAPPLVGAVPPPPGARAHRFKIAHHLAGTTYAPGDYFPSALVGDRLIFELVAAGILEAVKDH